MNGKLIDVIVIGAGAAGMTAALYSLRANKSVLLIENTAIGGQIANSPRVENYPTIKDITGEELSSRLFEQISDLGVQFEFDNVLSIEKEENIFKVVGEYATFYSKACIIASGAKHRSIGVKGEDELVGKGVSYCAVCDGAFYKGKNVVLIGDANTALQYAILLSNYVNKLYINTLFDHFFGEKRLVDVVREKKNIEIAHNLSLQSFEEKDGYLTGLNFIDTQTKEKKHYKCDGCFIAIGQIPDNDRFKNLCTLDKNGYIITDENMMCNVSGLYAAGDCRQKKVRQLTTAVNDGAIASINACNYIDTL